MTAEDVAKEILKNCAGDYVRPESRNPEDPQWRIDCAIKNASTIILAYASHVTAALQKEIGEADTDCGKALARVEELEKELREVFLKAQFGTREGIEEGAKHWEVALFEVMEIARKALKGEKGINRNE